MGGAERVIVWLASRLVAQGHSVNMVVFTLPETDFYECDPRVSIARPARMSLVFANSSVGGKLRRTIKRLGLGWLGILRDFGMGCFVKGQAKKSQADLVISFQSTLNIAVMMGMYFSRIPVVLSERSQPFISREGEPRAWGRFLRPMLYRRARGVVVLSEDIARQARSRWAGVRLSVVPNATALAPSHVPAMGDRGRKVLCVGRLDEIKNHLTLIEAWAKSTARMNGWTLVIVGEGPMRPALELAIQRLDLSQSVTLPGASRDVMPQYLSASVFALPSRLEGFPNALIEAMTCGCACVASVCSGAVTEMLAAGEAGVLVPVGDQDALTVALDRLTSDTALRERFGAAAWTRSQFYSEDRVSSLWDEVLASAMEGYTQGRTPCPAPAPSAI